MFFDFHHRFCPAFRNFKKLYSGMTGKFVVFPEKGQEIFQFYSSLVKLCSESFVAFGEFKEIGQVLHDSLPAVRRTPDHAHISEKYFRPHEVLPVK
jgi:hypothetical protein